MHHVRDPSKKQRGLRYKGVREIFTIVLPGLPSCEAQVDKRENPPKNRESWCGPFFLLHGVSVPLPCFLWESGIRIHSICIVGHKSKENRGMREDLRIK